MSGTVPALTEPLAVSERLFSELTRRRVRYVHWKSNEHLEAALQGETDLDLLVHRSDRQPFESALNSLGFLRVRLPRPRVFPGREGFFGFDAATGRMTQLDVHYDLVLGEQLVKNHHLPIEDWLLADAEELNGVRIPSAAKETIVFYVRVLLKSTVRQRLTAAIRKVAVIPKGIRGEAQWLADRVGPTELEDSLADADLPIPVDDVKDFHHRISVGDLGWQYLGRGKRTLLRRLRRYQRGPALFAWVRKGFLRFRTARLARRLGLGIPPKRLQSPAPLIAVVGADGSGKSLLTNDMAEWLGWKLSVRHLYFGQPKSGFLFKLLNKPGSLVRGANRHGVGAAFLERVSPVTDAMKWLYLARKRRRMSEDARERARAGEVVFAERFPLAEFWDMPVPMDGPRLQMDGSRLADLELAEYAAVERPDLILVLSADLATLRGRKTDLGVDEHRSKVDAVAKLRPGPGVYVIDASQPYADVLLQAKRRIWEEIVATR